MPYNSSGYIHSMLIADKEKAEKELPPDLEKFLMKYI
jgi:hypothetical protein